MNGGHHYTPTPTPASEGAHKVFLPALYFDTTPVSDHPPAFVDLASQKNFLERLSDGSL